MSITCHFNSLFDTKQLFDNLVKSKDEAYGKLVEMSRNNYYTTGTSLDYFYHQKYYNFIGKDLSNTSIPQQINFTEN